MCQVIDSNHSNILVIVHTAIIKSASIFFSFRILSRLAVIPFSFPAKPLRGKERLRKEQDLRMCQVKAHESIGVLVSLNKVYKEDATQDLIYGSLTEWVLDYLGDEFTRKVVNYAEVIGFTTMVSIMTNSLMT